jgi:hypothetical protein
MQAIINILESLVMYVRIMIIYLLIVLNSKIILKEISKDTLKKLKKVVNTYYIFILL